MSELKNIPNPNFDIDKELSKAIDDLVKENNRLREMLDWYYDQTGIRIEEAEKALRGEK